MTAPECSTFWGTTELVRAQDSHEVWHHLTAVLHHYCELVLDHEGDHRCFCGAAMRSDGHVYRLVT